MNKKIKRTFSIILVACMLLSLVPLHAASLNEEEDSISNELIVDDELSIDSNVEKSNNTESSLSSEQEISSSTISNNDMGEIKTSDETESSLSLDSEEEIAEQQDILTMADEETEEPENDNWELGLVFYDSTVDNGKTPLTEINWDASDGSYKEGTPRVITVQINYKNTNAVTTYQQGDVEISIPNLVYNTSSNSSNSPYWKSSVIVGANDSTHTGYDWNFITGTSPTNNQEIYTFKNANIIEEKSNFEGSIQIVYTITPVTEYIDSHYWYVEQFDDECIHKLNKILNASLNKLESNKVDFNYIRIYSHVWKKTNFNISKYPMKIESYDGLGKEASKYIWVRYRFSKTNSFYNSMIYPASYPYIPAKNGIYKDKIPKECIVYDNDMNLLQPDGNGYYCINANYTFNSDNYIYVGYPKAIYNEDNENLNIHNEVELWGTYLNKSEEEILSIASTDINLADYEFNYTGELYSIDKYRNNRADNIFYYQDVINNGLHNKVDWSIVPSAIYSGKPMTLKIGDDIIFASDGNNNYTQLQDDEFYFSKIYWDARYFVNGNKNVIESNKYDCELWIRYNSESSYTLYNSFKNPEKTITWNFKEEDGVVGFYFIIYDMEESLSTLYPTWGLINAETTLNKKDIPMAGTLYNFDYLQIYFRDNENNLILQNEPDISSYSNFVTKNDIANFDIKNYGNYMQRGTDNAVWRYYNVNKNLYGLYPEKQFSEVIQNVENESFDGTCAISSFFKIYKAIDFNYKEQYDNSLAIQGFKIYDLLPKGMELISKEKEIINSLDVIKRHPFIRFYDLDFNEMSIDSVKQLIDTDVEIINNWNNTGRTKIIIIGKFKNPIFINMSTGGYGAKFNYEYNFRISYDSFLEYGNIWTNYCYTDKLDIQGNSVQLDNSYLTLDNGKYDPNALDIDGDGSTTDSLTYSKAQTTITSVVSTHQDVIKYVQTDLSNYSTGKVESSYDSEYEYKLRVRTGQNDITNLVIYDSVEEYAQNPNGDIVPVYGTKKHWNGEFLGVDTSYAESKGYKVNVYYSEDEKVGNLDSDDSWKEYDDTVNKNNVKSLAFEYLDVEGNPAKLPANSLTYVLIKMKSPADENITSLAYNGCRTQWQALDDYDRPVDFITGINSNIVKVSLPNSVEDKEVNLSFNKIIDATDEDFEKLKLNKDNNYNFFISLTNQETGDIINGLLDSKEGFRVNNIPIGTYIIEEQNDIWFSFVSIALMEPIEGIDFSEKNGAYIISIGESVESGTTANIEVTNKPNEERFYDSKYDIKNLFTPTM